MQAQLSTKGDRLIISSLHTGGSIKNGDSKRLTAIPKVYGECVPHLPALESLAESMMKKKTRTLMATGKAAEVAN